MASFSLTMDRCAKAKECNNMRELGLLLRQYPELTYVAPAMAAVITAIPQILHRSKEVSFDMTFIHTIIEMYRENRCNCTLARMVQNKDTDEFESSTNDRSLYFLTEYVTALTAETNGECFMPNAMHTEKNLLCLQTFGIEDCYEYMGWLFLITTPNQMVAKMVSNGIFDNYAKDARAREGFLHIFADACCPMTNRDAGVALLSDVWGANLQKRPDANYSPFYEALRKVDIEWATNELRKEAGEDEQDSAAVNDATELFVQLSNIMGNSFARENYFYEYLAMIAIYYPLVEERESVVSRYEKYFPGKAMIYLIDLSTGILDSFSKVLDYHSTPGVELANRRAAKRAESVIVDMHLSYPNVSSKIFTLFINDVCQAFGKGFIGASVGIQCYTDPIIQAVFEKSRQAIEADTNYLDLLDDIAGAQLALEGVYANTEPKGEAENIVKSSSLRNNELHKRASIDLPKNMKAAEHKIYAAYHSYKDNEEKIDQQLGKGLGALKSGVTKLMNGGDQGQILVEGKSFSPVGFLKKALGTVAIFDTSKIAGILFVVVSHTTSKKTKRSEKIKIMGELEAELEMVNEKIEDAKGDGNREAKYELMRTRNALQNAMTRIKYGIKAETMPSDRLRSQTQATGYKG